MSRARSEKEPLQILLIEGNPIDAAMLRRALQEQSRWSPRVHVAERTGDAMKYLLSPEIPKPDLVILDLTSASTNVSDLFELIRATNRLDVMPLLMLAGSAEQRARYNLHTQDIPGVFCVKKPATATGWQAAARTVWRYSVNVYGGVNLAVRSSVNSTSSSASSGSTA